MVLIENHVVGKFLSMEQPLEEEQLKREEPFLKLIFMPRCIWEKNGGT